MTSVNFSVNFIKMSITKADPERQDEVEEEETGAHDEGGQDDFARMMEDNQRATPTQNV